MTPRTDTTFGASDGGSNLEDFIVFVISMNWTFLRVSGDKISDTLVAREGENVTY